MSVVSDERAVWLERNILPHEPALRSWLGCRRLDDLEVDDIVQETYTRLAAAENVDHIRNPKNYAFQIAGSVVIDHMRRKKVVSIASVADIDQVGLVSDEPSPEARVIGRDELCRLAEAIGSLPPRVREVFTLRRIKGLSQKEISSQLGINEGTVERHMTRALFLLSEDFLIGGKGAPRPSKPRLSVNRVEPLNGAKNRS
jgi:RNA polymerase sigma-70 factor (ECF subfamily)